MARHLVGRLGLAAVALVVALPACARSGDTSNPTGGQVTILASGTARIHSRKAPGNFAAPASSANQRHSAKEAVSAIAPGDDPAPSTSLPVLRIWWYDAPEEPPDSFISALTARDDPDPNVRLHALEAWARHPGVSLDPATYALVDPDEAVRARAQELFEQELDRR